MNLRTTLPLIAALTLAGCGVVTFDVTRADGTRVQGMGAHLFSNPTLTGAHIATTQATVQVDGFKSDAQMTALDLLKAAAMLAPKP